jgi:molybdenum cofactor cytidylyltransferase
MRAAILLAAGSSRRFGRTANKLLAPRPGGAMLDRALATARAAPAARLIVVTGQDAVRVARRARGPRTTIVHAGDHRRGLSASLRAGVRALRQCERAAFILLADMPWLDPCLAGRLARGWRPGLVAARPFARGRGGHPVLATRALLAQVAAARGDRGLAGLLDELPSPALGRLRADRRCLADADTPRALRARVPALR